jgi:hypothetical protein
MTNNFYGSTQSRLKTVTSDRRVEEHNGDVQQAKVYQQLAIERGDIETADRLSKLATMVVNKFGQDVMEQKVVPPVETGTVDIRVFLKKAIQSGTLSKVWNAIKKISNKDLSPMAKIVKNDIKGDTMLKEEINSLLEDMVKNKTDMNNAVNDMIQLLVGSKENEDVLKELILKATGILGRVNTTTPTPATVTSTQTTTPIVVPASVQTRGHNLTSTTGVQTPRRLMRRRGARQVARRHVGPIARVAPEALPSLYDNYYTAPEN